MEQPLIKLIDVHKRFGDLPVLSGLNLDIYKGQVTTIIGRIGAGKSVLLNHIGGLMAPDDGRILLDGRPLPEMEKEIVKSGQRAFSFILRETALFDSLTVFENIALPLRAIEGLSESDIKGRVNEKTAQLELGAVSGKYPFQLSGEVKKYAVLARALVTGPEVVLFDQPTTGMDPIRKNAVHSVIADCQKALNFTAVITSHDVPDVFQISHRIALLENGKILFEGSPEEILQVKDPVVSGYIQAKEDLSRETEITGRYPLPYLSDQAYPGDFALVVLSVKNMDEIREKLGNEESDKALRKLTAQIQATVRGADRCSIFQPDKIQIQLPHTDMEQSRQVCAKLAEAMKSGKIEAVQPEPGVFFSIDAGFAQAKGDSPVDQVVALAESMQTPFYTFDLENISGEE